MIHRAGGSSNRRNKGKLHQRSETQRSCLTAALDAIVRESLAVLRDYRPEERPEQAMRLLAAEEKIRRLLHIPYSNPLTPEEEAELDQLAQESYKTEEE